MGVGEHGCVDMNETNVVELASVSKAIVRRAFELVSLILRIDCYFYVKDLPLVHRQ